MKLQPPTLRSGRKISAAYPDLEMPRRGMTSPECFFLADCLGNGAIQLERRGGCASRRAESQYAESIPTEVYSPRFSARIEQRNLRSGSRITRLEPRALSQRTRDAGERKVCGSRFTAGVKREHMVDMESRFLSRLRQTAIFAAVPGSLNDLAPEFCRDVHSLTPAGDSIAQNEDARGKAFQPGQPGPLLLASRLPSAAAPDPAGPAEVGAVSERLLANETGPDHPASPPRLEWLEAYGFSVRCPNRNRRRSSCPSFGAADYLSARLLPMKPFSSFFIRPLAFIS